MSAEFLERGQARQPLYIYDPDLSDEGRRVCDELFEIIDRDPETAASVYAQFATSTQAEAAAEIYCVPLPEELPARELIQSTGRVFAGDHDFYVAYDYTTERTAKELRERHKNHYDGNERTRIGRLALYAARLAIFNSQNPEGDQTAATA